MNATPANPLSWPRRPLPVTSVTQCPLRSHVDPRLVRFSAGATAAVLGIGLLIMHVARPLGVGLLASQVATFALTAFISFQWSVWARIYARYIWPRMETPSELLDARPVRLSQLASFLLTGLALVFFVVNFDVAGYCLTALAISAAALNASTGLRLSSKVYLFVRRRE